MTNTSDILSGLQQSLELALDLYPEWHTTPAIIDLFKRKLTSFDQRRVQDAIREHKVSSQNFKAPDLGKILNILLGDKRTPTGPTFDEWMRTLPDDQARIITTYKRIAQSGTPAQYDVVKGYIAQTIDTPTLWRDPLMIGADAVIDDAALPTLLRRWIDHIKAATDPATPRMGAARVVRAEAGVARSVASSTRYGVNVAKRREEIQRQAAAVGGAAR